MTTMADDLAALFDVPGLFVSVHAGVVGHGAGRLFGRHGICQRRIEANVTRKATFDSVTDAEDDQTKRDRDLDAEAPSTRVLRFCQSHHAATHRVIRAAESRPRRPNHRDEPFSPTVLNDRLRDEFTADSLGEELPLQLRVLVVRVALQRPPFRISSKSAWRCSWLSTIPLTSGLAVSMQNRRIRSICSTLVPPESGRIMPRLTARAAPAAL